MANVKVTQAGGGLGGGGNLHHAYIIGKRSKIMVKSVLRSGHSSYIVIYSKGKNKGPLLQSLWIRQRKSEGDEQLTTHGGERVVPGSGGGRRKCRKGGR